MSYQRKQKAICDLLYRFANLCDVAASYMIVNFMKCAVSMYTNICIAPFRLFTEAESHSKAKNMGFSYLGASHHVQLLYAMMVSHCRVML